MEQLFSQFYRLLEEYSKYQQMRYLYEEINWDNRLILIRGPKGTGKTTLLLQHIHRTFENKKQVLYCSVDHFWFASHTLLDLAEYCYTHGITHIFLDEIHKYENWARELKNIYDSYPELYVVVTGSNALDIIHQVVDLSRRCRVYAMQGLSFREYLKLEGIADLPKVSLEEIVTNHTELSAELLSNKKSKSYFILSGM